MRNIFNNVAVALLVTILGLSIVPSSAVQLNIPKEIKLEQEFTNQLGNDMYIQVPKELQFVEPSFYSPLTDFNLYKVSENGRTGATFVNAEQSVYLDDPNVLYHLNNQTSDNMTLNFKGSYYDLTDSVNNGSVVNTILYQNKAHIFTLDIKNAGPKSLSVGTQGIDSFSSLTISILSPSGEIDTQTINLSNNVNNFIPLYLMETGKYLVKLTPPDENLVLDKLSIDFAPNIVGVDGGYSDRLQGEGSFIKFFKLNTTHLEDTSIVEFETRIFESDFLDPALKGIMGSVNIYLFRSYDIDKFFGYQGSTTSIIFGEVEIYMAVVVTGPDDTDTFIKAKKTELELPLGYDVSYSYWFNIFDDMKELPFFENTQIDDETNFPNYSNKYWYYYTVNQDSIIGVNATGRIVTAVFYNLDDPIQSIQIKSNINDVYNSPTDNLGILVPGNYIVQVMDNKNDPTFDAFFSIFDVESIGQDSTGVVNLQFKKYRFIYLPVTKFETSYLNLTYVNHQNMTVVLDWSLYDSAGTNFDDGLYTFDQYSSVDVKNYVQNNFTSFGSTLIDTDINIDGWYIRLLEIGNILYNTSFVDPENQPYVKQNFVGTTSQFQINRGNYLDRQKTLNPNNVYEQPKFLAGYTQFLNVANTSIYDLFEFNVTQGGYRILLRFTNASYNLKMLNSDQFDWYTYTNTLNAGQIDTLTNFTVELEFGFLEDTNFAFILSFAMGSRNGTFEILSIERTDIMKFSTFNFPQISEDVIVDEGGFNMKYLLYGGIGLGVVGIAGGTFAYLRKRSGGALFSSKRPKY